MIARVAASCFWMTRYFERLDAWARLLDVSSGFSLDAKGAGADSWRPLVVVVGEEQRFLERHGAEALADAEAVQRFLVWDEEQPSSLYSSLRMVRENARTVREVLTIEAWETINRSWLWLNDRRARRLYERERGAFYQHLSGLCMMFHGISHSTMLHDEAFHFMKLGRAVERVGQAARILDVHHHALGPREDGGAELSESAQWLTILRSCAAMEPFSKKAPGTVDGTSVARFLLFDASFPRSVLHNVERASERISLLRRGDPRKERRGASGRAAGLRQTLLELADGGLECARLHDVLTWIVEENARLCDAIHADFLESREGSLRVQVQRLQAGPSTQAQAQGAGSRA